MRLLWFFLALAILGPWFSEYGLKLASEVLILGLYAMALSTRQNVGPPL